MSIFITIIAGLLLGGICAFVYENLPFQKVVGVKKLVVGGYKFHHSLYGVILITFSFIFRDNYVFLASSGLGVIIEHYLTGGGFDFITKE